MQQEGKIRHIGLSEVKPAEIANARKMINVVSVQNQFNISDRQHEDTLLYCQKHGIGFIPWFPVAAGKLVQPGGVLDGMARKHSVTPSQLALAWLLQRSPVILPIPGTSSVKHLEENAAAADIKLNATEWESLEEQAKVA
jgi:aryl-alcohol dehydrogenase-like predicted oxidoreductase